MSTERPLTHLQAQVLGAIAESRNGATASEVAEDILCSVSSARTAATALERRRLVEATYTKRVGVGRAYEITKAGEAALAATFGEDS